VVKVMKITFDVDDEKIPHYCKSLMCTEESLPLAIIQHIDRVFGSKNTRDTTKKITGILSKMLDRQPIGVRRLQEATHMARSTFYRTLRNATTERLVVVDNQEAFRSQTVVITEEGVEYYKAAINYYDRESKLNGEAPGVVYGATAEDMEDLF
jgi:predicted transcriptional regulator